MIPCVVLLLAAPPFLWEEPRNIETIDFTRPAAGARPPLAPFTWMQEEKGGTSAKVLLRDGAGAVWQAKGGPEGRAEAFVTRLVSAMGYFAEPTVFLARGTIRELPQKLNRAAGFIQPDGTFTWAALELRDSTAKFLPEAAWHWNRNAFTDKPELKGLKLLVMLVSNWDNKDSRDQRRGPNTGVLEMPVDGKARQVFFVTDWGQSLGAWGEWFGRTHWSCGDYQRQTPDFVKVDRSGALRFGYAGQHTSDFTAGITAEDVRWFMQYLGRVTDAQIRAGLMEAGATREEEACFSSALRKRIEALRRIAEARPKLP